MEDYKEKLKSMLEKKYYCNECDEFKNELEVNHEYRQRTCRKCSKPVVLKTME